VLKFKLQILSNRTCNFQLDSLTLSREKFFGKVVVGFNSRSRALPLPGVVIRDVLLDSAGEDAQISAGVVATLMPAPMTHQLASSPRECLRDRAK
jgi:hypothetical protein